MERGIHREFAAGGLGAGGIRQPDLREFGSLIESANRKPFMKLRFVTLLLAVSVALAAEPIDPARLTTMIEALTRLGPEQVKANPRLSEALGRVLEATRGTAQFVQLVTQFQIKGQEAGLLEIAAKQPTEEAGVTAARLVLDSGELAGVRAVLGGTNAPVAARLVEALGNAGGKRVTDLLLPLVGDGARDVTVRKQAVRALARSQEGAAGVLALAKADKLPADVKFTATTELNAVRWPELKAQAAQILPPPQGQGTSTLPPVAELVKRVGDPKRGAEVFRRETVGCAKCHVVNGDGVDFGPALSEIGKKLGKDALYESIIDPSAGISFGFEAWQVELKNGDELFGLITSETGEDLSVKLVGGAVNRIKKAEVARRQQSKLSIMPAGLQQTMTTDELVDLIEYLVSLQKAAK